MTKVEATIAEDATGYTVLVTVSETADATDGERDVSRLLAADIAQFTKRTEDYMRKRKEAKQCKR